MKKLLLLTLAIGWHSQATGQECPGSHCSAKSETVNRICRAQGRNGEPVFVEHNGDFCYCVCSCLAQNTLVATDSNKWTPIGDIKVGSTVLALSADGSWKPQPVVFSDGTDNPTSPYPYAIYLSLKDGPSLISTADHLYMTDTGLRRADRLSPSDKVLDKDKKPLEIESLTNGVYFGGIHNIVAKDFPSNPQHIDTEGHLINTAGVISGDYFLQLYQDELVERSLASRPQVGGPEFSKQHSGYHTGLKEVISLGEKEKFIPARKFEPPKGACSFLPRGQDEAKPGFLAPMNDSISLAMANYLVSHYRTFYPDVHYHVEWNDNTVNAYAWQENNGEKHVALLGGLLRHQAIRLEGAGLVLSHEIGHHKGGRPRYPNHPWPSSCEGQADYWGALVAQRKVWFGTESMRQTEEGAQQLYDLFANGLTAGNLLNLAPPANAAGLCSHPHAQCRLDTYRAAMRADDKPACAGDPPQDLFESLTQKPLESEKSLEPGPFEIIYATVSDEAELLVPVPEN